jgi:glycosyltransferase involved in cell wall biosynthesis
VAQPKVALVCDWLTVIGGAERVVLELHKLYPDAPIYTSQYDPIAIDWFNDADIQTTWLQKLPKNLKKFLPPLRALTFSHLNLKDYDLVISCSGAEAKGVKVPKGTTHILYCHAPTHYYWSRYNEYMNQPGFGAFNWLARLGLKLFVGPMRRWDYKAAQRPDFIIANSTHIQSEIKKYYNRESRVIHPPVDVERFKNIGTTERQGYVIAGRQTPYKRIDLAVAACTQLNLPLTVIGNGPDHQKLVDMAGPSVTFIPNASDSDIAKHFASAAAFIFPGLDDFGITPVEAMAAGTPVIAYKAGGALDYVVEGKTGTFFDQQTTESLQKTLEEFSLTSFDSSKIQDYSKKFSIGQFQHEINDFINGITKN